MSQKTQVDQDFTNVKVPAKSRVSFASMFFIMLGFTFFSASMSTGARMGNGLLFPEFITAILVGGAILGTYTAFLAYIGSTTGLSLDLLARRAFGQKGSYLPSALISFTQIGWFGVGVAMFAVPVSEMFGINPYLLIAIAGVCMTASAYFGIKGLEIISYISVPLITVLGLASVFMAINQGGGVNNIFAKSSGMSVSVAIGMVVGSFVSGGTATPNFVRFSKSAKHAVIATIVAFFIGNSLMFIFGAVGGAFTGKDDIFYVMMAQGAFMSAAAVVVLGMNIWTTNDNALYSSGLGLSNITKYPKKPLVIIAGVVGTVTAMWLYNNFVGWLAFLSTTLPPIGIILILDFFAHKDLYLGAKETKMQVNWFAIAGVVLGGLVANYVAWGIAPINAMVVAAVCYYVGEFISKRA